MNGHALLLQLKLKRNVTSSRRMSMSKMVQNIIQLILNELCIKVIPFLGNKYKP